MKNTAIEWADHTYNPWWGCTKVSAGCKHCYAEAIDKRFHRGSHWGPEGVRKACDARHSIELTGLKPGSRVFVGSMCDVFEMPESHANRQVVERQRQYLWGLTRSLKHLTFMLLTKRPENILYQVPREWYLAQWPANVWVGTSVENQETAELRIPHLLKVPAPVRFLSIEPLLEEVILHSWWLFPMDINWVIVGGESGPGARPMHPDWVRRIRDECTAPGINVPFFFKQWGGVQKHKAGRVLDGRTWDELPTVGAECA
ncbi:MAG: phage Gp37/Gp68 family protein [Bacteroidia bacterium]|nr:phage Gp37/Gp68 family protein [Bacteroidia bacterium]